MGSDKSASRSAELNPLLDPLSFRQRLAQEAARVRRAGGFLSLALIGMKPDASGSQRRLASVAHRLRVSVRLHDVIAWRGSTLAVLMPDAIMIQAVKAAERLVRIAGQAAETAAPEAGNAPSAGVATIYGAVEGGGEALMEAAAEALRAAAPGEVARSSTLSGRPRVLVVDDDEAFAEVLAETISERGWDGHPCSHVEDALQRVTDAGYSALFIDLVLPKISGVELLRRSLSVQPTRPAVLMSGYDADHDAVLEALSLGPVMFVKKPIAPPDLDAALAMFRELLPGAGRRR